MSLAARLKQLRVAKGESLQEVAEAVQSSKAHIWELEVGRSKNPSLELLSRLASHFKVTIAFVLGEDRAADILVFGREFKNATDEDKALIIKMAERIVRRKGDG